MARYEGGGEELRKARESSAKRPNAISPGKKSTSVWYKGYANAMGARYRESGPEQGEDEEVRG